MVAWRKMNKLFLPVLLNLSILLAGPSPAFTQEQTRFHLLIYAGLSEPVQAAFIKGYQFGAVGACDFAFRVASTHELLPEAENRNLLTQCVASCGLRFVPPDEIHANIMNLAEESFADKIDFVEAMDILGYTLKGDPRRRLNYSEAKQILTSRAKDR